MSEETKSTAIDARREALREILDLAEGERLERLYLFEPIARRDIAYSLALVTKRIGEDRLELVAIGGRAAPPAPPDHDFVRRAQFPERVLPRILEELVDRGGAGQSGWREISLEVDSDPLEALARALEPRAETA